MPAYRFGSFQAASHAIAALGLGARRLCANASSSRIMRFTAPLRPLHRHYALLRQIRPDAIHANEWPVLPVAAMTKKETGAHRL